MALPVSHTDCIRQPIGVCFEDDDTSAAGVSQEMIFDGIVEGEQTYARPEIMLNFVARRNQQTKLISKKILFDGKSENCFRFQSARCRKFYPEVKLTIAFGPNPIAAVKPMWV